MFEKLITALRALLLEGIANELQRINRDVTEDDSLSFFSYPERYDDDVIYITSQGTLMCGEEDPSTLTLDALDLDTLEVLYAELKALDDNNNGTLAVGRAVLATLNLEGKDIEDVTLEDETHFLIHTQDRIYSFNTFEVNPFTGGEI